MRRITRSLATVACAALVVAGFATAAGAQRTPVSSTAPRTTIPTVSPQADSYPVLQESDLPARYSMGTGSPQRRTGISASYPSIDKCVWDSSNPMSGLTPVIYFAMFQRTADETGQETVWEFDDAKAATAYFGSLEKAYRAATKCKMVKTPSSSDPSDIVNIGKFSLSDAPDLGDESLGVDLEPSSSIAPPTRYVFLRDGSSVAALRMSDEAFTAKQFAALAKVAAKRLS